MYSPLEETRPSCSLMTKRHHVSFKMGKVTSQQKITLISTATWLYKEFCCEEGDCFKSTPLSDPDNPSKLHPQVGVSVLDWVVTAVSRNDSS